jgi:hypothetical protein
MPVLTNLSFVFLGLESHAAICGTLTHCASPSPAPGARRPSCHLAANALFRSLKRTEPSNCAPYPLSLSFLSFSYYYYFYPPLPSTDVSPSFFSSLGLLSLSGHLLGLTSPNPPLSRGLTSPYDEALSPSPCPRAGGPVHPRSAATSIRYLCSSR